ncbi:MAG: ABC-F type ribosomal protection protein [Limnochordia bacterium]|nr:ABC-F type ribosomal protection protein [Limnochordia bacterium]MDD2630228.1 ABC-F type ribosomal protection protein [Limnochordia bacterium]
MLILEALNIEKYYGDRRIVKLDEFKVHAGDKIGLVGQNGSGKTTLMNILAKEIVPDAGFVKHYYNLAYIRQFSLEDINASPEALSEFRLSDKLDQDIHSGGERTRIRIANAFSQDPILLLADEPTANLDYRGIELFQQKLATVDSFILICHDRSLLDSLCNRIVEIKGGRLRFYDGNYSFYQGQREKEIQSALAEYEKYESDKRKLERAIRDRQRKSKRTQRPPRRMSNSEARLHKAKASEKQEKIHNAVGSLKARLERLEVRERPKELPGIKLDFSLTDSPGNKVVISAEGLSFAFGRNRLFSDASFRVYNGSKTALWGENGTGKTTLLNLINNRAKGISIVPKARIGYFRQDFENLEPGKSVLENVMQDGIQKETVARTILARLLIQGDDVYKSVGMLSGGEKIKVSFAKLFVSDANVLLLDEPTNYLDMGSVEALESVLCDYEGTVLFVSHDRTFVDRVADKLLIFEDQTIKEFEGSIDEYMLGKEKTAYDTDREMERMVRQMRMAELVAKLQEPGADKDALEAEYERLILEQE